MWRKIEHNNKQKKSYFFVVLRNGQALLGMPDIEILDILDINCNTTGTQEADRATKCNTNTDNDQILVGEQLYTNPRQAADRLENGYTNIGNSNLKSNNVDKPMVKYYNSFFPGVN